MRYTDLALLVEPYAHVHLIRTDFNRSPITMILDLATAQRAIAKPKYRLQDFCGEEVGALVNRNADTWTEQWRHSPCPHIVSILSNGQPALMIPGVTRQRATSPGRLHLKACLQGNEIVYEFAPLHAL